MAGALAALKAWLAGPGAWPAVLKAWPAGPGAPCGGAARGCFQSAGSVETGPACALMAEMKAAEARISTPPATF